MYSFLTRFFNILYPAIKNKKFVEQCIKNYRPKLTFWLKIRQNFVAEAFCFTRSAYYYSLPLYNIINFIKNQIKMRKTRLKTLFSALFVTIFSQNEDFSTCLRTNSVELTRTMPSYEEK